MSTFRKNLECSLHKVGILRKIPQFKLRGKGSFIAGLLVCFLVVSCVDKLPDYPVPLDTPIADFIKVNNSDPSKLVFSWPDVEDSDGFEFTLYEVDGEYTALGAVPKVIGIIGEEKQVVYGTSVERPQADSTFYQVELRVLGDKKNRSNAQKATTFYWDNAPRWLPTPTATQIIIDAESDPSKLSFSWPNVEKAIGFEFSLYKVDENGENPVAVGVEAEILTGTSVERPQEATTYYKIVLKALGPNDYVDGKLYVDGITTVRYWSNVQVQKIPTGTNLTQFFADNPVSGEELATFELDEDGVYTMNGNIDLGTTPVTIRAKSKSAPAKITITDGSFVTGGAGFKLENVEMDYSGHIGTLASTAVVMMKETLPAGATLTFTGYYVTDPIVFQSCKITGIKSYFFYDNGGRDNPAKYALRQLNIDDCIIGFDQPLTGDPVWNAATIRFAAGVAKEIKFNNSTFYNETPVETADPLSSRRFIQFQQGNHPLSEADPEKCAVPEWGEEEGVTNFNGRISITNCTFYQLVKSQHFFNTNRAMTSQRGTVYFNVEKNVFVDTGGGEVVRRLLSSQGDGAQKIVTMNENAYWYKGAFATNEISSGRDSYGTHIETDPGLNYVGNGQFTKTGAGFGDPRW